MYSNEEKTAEQWKEKGNNFYGRKAYQEALFCYEQACSIDPAFKEAWFNQGLCYKQLKQLGNAEKSFSKALDIDPAYEKAAYQLRVLRLPVHLFFGIVDLKVQADDRIKILEFGKGLYSSFAGFDALYPEKAMLDEYFYNFLFKIKPAYSDCHEDPVLAEQRLSLFLRSVDANVHTLSSSTKLADYKGIVYQSLLKPKIMAVPKDILVLDNAANWDMAAKNKYYMHQMIPAQLLKHRPVTKVYPMCYRDELAEDIQRSIPGSTYVLKTPDSSCGKGVIIVPAKALKLCLQFLLEKDERKLQACSLQLLRLRYEDKETADYVETIFKTQLKDWLFTKSSIFLVEQYCPSKVIKHEGKSYDPTMRVVFIMLHEEGNMRFIPLGSYWKLPQKALGEGSLREVTISHIADNTLCSLKVSADDEKKVYQQLSSCLPQLFLQCLFFNVPHYVQDLSTHPEPLFKQQACTMLLHYITALITLRREKEAFQLLKSLKEIPEMYYNEGGYLHLKNGDYPKAVCQYTKAIKKELHNPATFFFRAEAYRKLGEIEKASADMAIFEKSLKHS